MLKQRLIFGSILIAVLVAIFAVDHFTHTLYGFSAVLLIVNAIALYEFYAMHETKIQAKLPKHYGIIIGLLIISFCVIQNRLLPGILITLSIPLLLIWYLLRGNIAGVLNTYIILFGFAYISIPLACIYIMRTTYPSFWPGETFFYFFLVLNKTADTGAYFGGSLLGKHKLAPAISPKKTIEGLIGAIITGLIVGQLFWLFTSLGNTFHYFVFMLLSFIMTICGQVGDLIESMIKRYCGVKDSSVLFPALGGVLDLIDCLLFSGVIALIMVTIIYYI